MLGQVITAIVTPFRADGSIDVERFRALCSHLAANGSDGVVVAGTTGEAPTLTDEERLELVAAAVDELKGRATVIAGTGTYSTAHSVHLTAEAHALGADAFLVVTPYYNKPPARGVVRHFEAIADVTDRPIVVYNIPQRVVINIEPETMLELARIPQVKVVKQATTDLDQARFVVEQTDLALYAGNDDLILPFLEVGGTGVIGVFTHLVGARVKEIYRCFEAGDREGAHAIGRELEPLLDALAVTTNPIPIKAALNLLGHEVGGLRLPLVDADASEVAVVRAGLERVGLLAPAAV